MKKLTSIIIVILLIKGMTLFASPVDTSDVKTVALNFFRSNSNVEELNQTTQTTVNIVYVHPFTREMNASQSNALYVCNIGQRGFVVVSSDNRVEPILGYSLSEPFNPNDIPPAMLWLFDDYAWQIAGLDHLDTILPVHAQWEELMAGVRSSQSTGDNIVGPLITTAWGQSPYYNDWCPYKCYLTTNSVQEQHHIEANMISDMNNIGDTIIGDHAPTGCVAVAMGQLIHYWFSSQDVNGIGIHTNTQSIGDGLCLSKPMTVNFGATTYHHTLMPNQLTGDSSLSSKDEIAKLLYHCGVSVNMHYMVNASSAYSENVPDALLNHFGLEHAEWKEKPMFDLFNSWTNMLRLQIDSLRPVYYRGNSFSGTNGHAFLLDGYNISDGKFHVNWGWKGKYNHVYCALDDLSPSSADFNYNQSAIICYNNTPIIHISKTKVILSTLNSWPSPVDSITILTQNLDHGITVSATYPFLVSNTNSYTSFSNTTTLSPGNDKLYIRYVPPQSNITDYHIGQIVFTYDSMIKTVDLKGYNVVWRYEKPRHPQTTCQYPNELLFTWSSPDGQVPLKDTMSMGTNWRTTYRYSNTSYKISTLHRLTGEDLIDKAPLRLTKVSFIARPGASNYKIFVYKGGSVQDNVVTPGNLVVEQSIDPNSLLMNDWNTIALNTPEEVEVEKELWIGVYLESDGTQYVIPVGDTASYVPGKGDLYQAQIDNESWDWGFFNVNSNFCLQYHFESSPLDLTRYDIYRNEAYLASTTDTFYVDTLLQDGLYEYRVNAVYADSTEADTTASVFYEVPFATDTIHASFCQNSTYDFFGTMLDQAGEYSHNANHLFTMLYLDALPISETFDTLTFCTCDLPYAWNSLQITAAGDYIDTLVAANGCDSIVHLSVTAAPPQLYIDDKPLSFVAYDTSSSKVKTLVVKGNGYLTRANLVVSAPFEISTDSVSFVSSMTISPSDTTVYARYRPLQIGETYSDTGTLTVFLDNVQKQVPLKGHHISTVYPAPENLQYSMIFPDTVHLTWQTPASLLQTSKTLSLDSLWSGHAYGWDNQNYKVSFLHRYSEEDLLEVSPSQLTGVSFIPKEDATAYRVVAYKGGSYKDSVLTPGVLVVSQDVNMSSLTYNTWNTVNLDVPVPIEADEELWAGVYVEAPSGTYTITVGEIANYIPEKGDVECFHAANGHDYWLFFGVNRNFTLKAEFQVQPPVLQHYDVYQNDSLLASVGIDTDYKCKQQVNECDYRVTAVYEGQKSASDSVHFLLMPEIVVDTAVFEQVVLISQNNNPSDPVMVDIFGVGTSHPLSMSVSGPFEVGYDTTSFGHQLAFPNDSTHLLIRYAPTPTAKSYCEYGSLSIGYDTLSVEIPLKGYRIIRNYPTPVNLHYAQVLPDTVELTWQEPPLSIIEYAAYDTNWASSYMYMGGDYTVAMLNRYCDTDLVHFCPGKLSYIAFVAPTGITQCRVVAYQGGHVKDGVLMPGTQVVNQAVNLASLNMDQWNVVALNEPITVDLSKELWIGVYIKAANGYYTMAVGDSSTYVPEKGNIEVFYTANGYEYWRFFNHDVNFLIIGIFQSDSLELSHYRVQRGDSVLCTTSATNYDDVVSGPGTYLYSVSAVYSDGGEGQATINPYINAPLYYDTLNVEICSNENYNFFNTALNQQGVYYHFENQTWTVLDLQVKEAPDVAISASALYVPNPQPVTLTASGANTYVWSTGATSATISVSPENTTTYSVTGTSSLTNCTNTASVTIQVDHVGLEDVSLANISVFPNPANNLITVKGVQCDKFILCDMTGSVILEKEVDLGEENTLSVSDVASGVYLLKVVKEDSIQCVFKVVISR